MTAIFTSEMKVEYIDAMGSDARVVNAARVSFDKHIDESETASERDKKLIAYLANHSHWTPFAHCAVTLRVTIPVFLARQYFKHIVGSVKNEVSRRYVSSPPEFYLPTWREAPTDGAKQGSGEEIEDEATTLHYKTIVEDCNKAYERLLKKGICPEQARTVLPQNMMTSFYDTGSLVYWARMYNQRMEKTAQKEWGEVAERIGWVCGKSFPLSWKALTK